MTDLNNSTSNLCTILFANDTCLIFCSGKNLEKLELLINDELAHAQEWLMLNKLTLNVKNQISLLSDLIKGN